MSRSFLFGTLLGAVAIGVVAVVLAKKLKTGIEEEFCLFV